MFIGQDNLFCNEKLNIKEKVRSSRLPWRGQFSPELVEYLISMFFKEKETLFDPFCGSGTLLYEASSKDINAIGTEINPAAWIFSSIANMKDKISMLDSLTYINKLKKDESLDLSNIHKNASKLNNEGFVLIFSAAVILSMKNGGEFKKEKFKKSLGIIESMLSEIYSYKTNSICLLKDSRHSGIKSNSIDGVITSPPYINVFNYHQNYRPAVELLGWQPLQAAKSEIGANRKFRQNRFMTVVQYSIDMSIVINELMRVCKDKSKLVFVVGRESNVLGESFMNSKIINSIFSSIDGIRKIASEERFFINQFGKKIIEDVLVFESSKNKIDEFTARNIGVSQLIKSLDTCQEKNKDLISTAIQECNKIEQSPEFFIEKPTYY
ncbi:DNA methyltransferase [Xenorhabdus bovienii]|uniref:DNA methyltransferase n=1 Tax=Xenorhabdus bovienii TaxID=40576 RepID=UPI0023B21635|nr:DNA methyltransferase [Xenorhabdus bovienii]MDE9463438.1 site-specific DNA-methyltransferase [Xenorhabdus bovienii]MDE9471212.1 site-specific DNA-methyltransferase [Xenorhabdus bovienii]MDE9519440.1 site-specific DNA-methyltransferase [Xenorhabdus bovienii]